MMYKISIIFTLGYILYLIDLVNTTNVSILDLNYTRTRRQSKDTLCTLPSYPENGIWKLMNGIAKPFDKVASSTVAIYQCYDGYKLSSINTALVCNQGKWIPAKFPTCEKLCPPQYPSPLYEQKCIDKNKQQVDCTEATEGTYLTYECIRFYERPFGYKKTIYCRDGSWSFSKPLCQPVCGKKIEELAKPLIYGSKASEKLEYPWITAIYDKKNGFYETICGGSILSTKIVLTAAHCVTNNYGDVLPKENYCVGAGKLYSKYKATEDANAQYLELFKIIVHDNYRADSRRFLADLAALVTKGEFFLSDVVQPVCFDGIDDIYLVSTSIGEVSGWGVAEGGLQSEKLRTLKIPYKDQSACADELPSEFVSKYNMNDKMCAGLTNMSMSVCSGDSGSGLAYRSIEDGRYYIHGIVSIGPRDQSGCNIQQNTLYTKAVFYLDFIDKIMSQYTPDENCILPPHPANGKWRIDKMDKQPGDSVTASTILKVKCNQGYKLSSSITNIECSSAHNMPNCQKLCPALNIPKGATYRCFDNYGHIINCVEATDGSVLTYTCPNGYQMPEGVSDTRTCTGGSWDMLLLECSTIQTRSPLEPFEPFEPLEPLDSDCGTRTNIDSNEDGLEYPWNVAIYDITKDYMHVCGGSILSNKIILTAAHCVTDEALRTLPIEDLVIAAGKLYPNYDDHRDTDIQTSEVSEIILNERFGQEKSKYLADIAVLVLKTPFTFNNFIQRICFKNVVNIRLEPENEAVVFGWSAKETSIILYEYKSVKTTYYSTQPCRPDLPPNRAQFLDKLYVELDGTKGLCRGDLGTGLAVQVPEDGRYYIYGVVSTSSNVSKLCQDNIFSTSVPVYYNFINNLLTKYQ